MRRFESGISNSYCLEKIFHMAFEIKKIHISRLRIPSVGICTSRQNDTGDSLFDKTSIRFKMDSAHFKTGERLILMG